jgi:hypothetical protein
VHRIGRLVEPRGIEMFMGSQWFMVPRHFAHWLLTNELPIKYSHYARHVVVADENFFATMARNRYAVTTLVHQYTNTNTNTTLHVHNTAHWPLREALSVTT